MLDTCYKCGGFYSREPYEPYESFGGQGCQCATPTPKPLPPPSVSCSEWMDVPGQKYLRHAEAMARNALEHLEQIQGTRLTARGMSTEATELSRARVALDRAIEAFEKAHATCGVFASLRSCTPTNQRYIFSQAQNAKLTDTGGEERKESRPPMSEQTSQTNDESTSTHV